MYPQQYAQLLYETLKDKSDEQQSQIISRFKNILEKNKNSYLAGSILEELEKIQNQKLEEKTTYIASATKLSEEQKGQLEDITAGPHEFSENPSLLGGIAVRRKDRVYNATTRKKVETLKNAI